MGLTLLLLRVVSRRHPAVQRGPAPTSALVEIPEHHDAVIVVGGEGRVLTLNPLARQWFDVPEEIPDLEHLARRSRPSEALLKLSAAEGQATFTLKGKSVEGTSYHVPHPSGSAMVVTLHTPREIPHPTIKGDSSNQALQIINKLTASTIADLALEPTLKSVLESIEELLPTDSAEATLWNADTETLQPYHLVGLIGLERTIKKAFPQYQLGKGFSGHIAKYHESLLIPNVASFEKIRPTFSRTRRPFQSYLGVPLTLGEEFLGTLEVTARNEDAFTENDLAVLELVSEQAAIAIHNSIIYQKEQERARELSSLAELSQVSGSARNLNELFSQLLKNIPSLLDVNIAGFLIYNENKHILEARNPFIGIPAYIIEMYKTEIAVGGPAEQVWEKEQSILTPEAPDDHRLQALGIDHIAQAAGIHATILVPLISRGRNLGYLQVANKKSGGKLTGNDKRLLEIIAGQTAPLIENAELLHQSIKRALRSEAIRRIANLAGSEATTDEILKYSLLELVRLIKAEKGAVFLLDESQAKLELHDISGHQLGQDTQIKFTQLASASDFHKTVTYTAQPIFSGQAKTDPDIPELYQKAVKTLQISSLIIVPLIIRGRGIGEILLSNSYEEAFQKVDLQLVSAIARQIASALERVSLTIETDATLRQRVEQLTALTRVSQALNSTLDLETLLQLVFEEAIRLTQANCGAIFLLEQGDTRPTHPGIMLHIGDDLHDELHPLERVVLNTGKTLNVDDFQPPTAPPHKGIRSSLIVPITYQDQVAGLIHLHASQAEHFDKTSRSIIEALSVQAAIALGNAQRYQQQIEQTTLLNQRVKILSNLFKTSEELSLDQPLEQALENIAYGIQASTSFTKVLISVYEEADQGLHNLSGVGFPLEALEELKEKPQNWNSLREILRDDFKFGRSYFIPSEDRPPTLTDIQAISAASQAGMEELGIQAIPKEIWRPEDLLVIPLQDTSGHPLGLIRVDTPQDHLRPTQAAVETLGIFASQASLAIESHKKLSELRASAAHVAREAETKRLEVKAKRIQSSLELISSLNRQPHREAILRTLGEEFLNLMGMNGYLITEPGSGGPRLLYTGGETPPIAKLNPLLGRQNPLVQSIRQREIVYDANINGDSNWSKSPLIQTLEARGIITIPITTFAGVEAAILTFSKETFPEFSPDEIRLYELLSQQASYTIQNVKLLTETSQRLSEVNILLDFSRKLGELSPGLIIKTLLESAQQLIPVAQGVMILLNDQTRKKLIPQLADGYQKTPSLLEITFSPQRGFVGKVFQSKNPLRLDVVNFAQDYELEKNNLLLYRDGTGGLLPISSLAAPIKTRDKQLGIVLLDNFEQESAFSNQDQALLGSLARQTALALDNVQLIQAAEQRATQLEALTQATSSITSSGLKREELVDTLLTQLATIISYDTSALWLHKAGQLTIRAARGFENNQELIGISTKVSESKLMYEMIRTGEPLVVSNIQKDARFPAAEQKGPNSWLGVPLLTKGQVLGVIALEKHKPGFYTSTHSQMLQTFGSQAAISIENAGLYQESVERAQELDQRTRRLAMLNRFSNELSRSLNLDESFQITLKELSELIHHSVISGILWTKEKKAILQAELSRKLDLRLAYPHELPYTPIFEHIQQSQGVFVTRNVEDEEMLAPIHEFFRQRGTKSLLILPLITGSDLQGFLFIQTDHQHRFTNEEIELSRIIANQAAISIYNALLTANLEQRVFERTRDLEREHDRSQMLLAVLKALSASLDLDEVLHHTLNLLNSSLEADQSTILLIRPEEEYLYYRAACGYMEAPPLGGRPSGLKKDEGLAGWAIAHNQSYVVDDILTDDRWVSTDTVDPDLRSAIIAPIAHGADILGAISLFSRQTRKFNEYQKELLHATAKQIAVAINNTQLVDYIQEQTIELGQMLRAQKVEASRSRAILESVADGVIVTNAEREITLFNDAAETILDLDRSKVVGKSLEQFSGLFGESAQNWIETIRAWSSGEKTTSEVSYSEQITLDNGAITSVQLAPVTMQDEFLGTVSNFRDITHQVEVDRLKSEFVATVSHELRTPMTSIKGYVDVMLMGAAGEMSDRQTDFLNIVKANTTRLEILVDDLLDISHLEAGRISISIQPIQIEPILREVWQGIQELSEGDQKELTFTLDTPPHLPIVNGDPERLHQVLGNLLANAYHYTPEDGHITLTVHAQSAKSEDEIQIDIKDTGVGIPPEDHAKVFERFYRGEDPLVIATSGTGLGLSIVQQLIQMHKGRIWLESNGVLGEGTTFSFTLPIHRET